MGDRQYVAYGNRFQDRFTVYLAYNRLEAQSHPMSYFIDNSGLHDAAGGTLVNGGPPDYAWHPSIIYGDTGPEKVNTNSVQGVNSAMTLIPELQTLFYSSIRGPYA